MDFSLLATKDSITMNDVMVTIAAVFAGWTKLAQKQKDEQIKERDETINYLKKELEYARNGKTR